MGYFWTSMPVDFLTDEQYQSYARYPDKLSQEQLDKYFYLDDKDRELINTCRRDYNKLGYALQLTTIRFLGTFLPNPINVPNNVICYLAKQLEMEPTEVIRPHFSGQQFFLNYSLVSQIPLAYCNRSWNASFACCNTFQCIQRYFALPLPC